MLILKELHDRLDVAIAEAYGWSADLTDDEILAKLVALNKERSTEEKRGLVRWLRPDYQIPRFAKGVDKQAAKEEGAQVAAELIAAVTAEVGGSLFDAENSGDQRYRHFTGPEEQFFAEAFCRRRDRGGCGNWRGGRGGRDRRQRPHRAFAGRG